MANPRRIVVVSSDSPIVNIALPLEMKKLLDVSDGSLSFHEHEERAVAKWCKSMHVMGVEGEPEDEFLADIIGGKRTTSAEDKMMAAWVLNVWAALEHIRHLL